MNMKTYIPFFIFCAASFSFNGDALAQSTPKFLGSMIVSCGPEGEAMTSFKVYEWYGTTIPAKYTGYAITNKALGIGDGKGCRYAGYFLELTPEEAIPAMTKELAKNIRKKVTSSVTGLRITTGEDGLTILSLTRIPVSMAGNGSGNTNNNQIQSSSADMSKFLNNSLLGSMIVYYGTGTTNAADIRSWYVYEVRGRELTDKNGLGNLLIKKVSTTNSSLGYEWRAGADCNTALDYVQRKTGKKIGGQCGGEVNTMGEYTTDRTKGLPGYHENSGIVTNDYINKLETYAWANVNHPIKDAEEKLIKDGWKRVYAEYNQLTSTQTINHNVVYEPGTSYTVLGTVKEGNKGKSYLMVIDGADTDNPYYFSEFVPGQKMIISDFHTTQPIQRLVFATRLDGGEPTNGGLVIYSRPVDHRRDLDAILADAPNGFNNMKAFATKDPNGVPVWVGSLGLGVKSRTIYESPSDKKMVYLLLTSLDRPEAAILLKDVLAIINDRVKAGLYTVKEGTVNGYAMTEVYDKTGKQIFKLSSSAANNSLRVYFFQ
jgi:hypothetical protein